MISSRRRAHRRIFTVLAVALPALLIAAVALRPEMPTLSEDVAPLKRTAGFASVMPDARSSVQSGSYAFETSIRAGDKGPLFFIRPLIPILEPDLLVYWTTTEVEEPSLPSDAVLLGHLAGASPRALPISEEAASGWGRALVYSLGYQKIVARVPLTPESGPRER